MIKPSILIVEDEAIVAEDLAGKIQQLGYDVAGITATGEEAVELARHQQRPALVLMDIRLAGAMDGITAAQQIIRECHLPVLFLTAHSDPVTVALARQTGALGYILKPFEERDLRIQIEMALYKHATESQLRLSLERHRILAETMLQGVVHADANSKILAINPAAERILGKSREQVVGSSPAIWEYHTISENGEPFPSSEYPSMIAVRTGLPVKGVIMGIFNPKLNGYRWISVDAVPVFSLGEKLPTEVFTVLEDVTDREYYKRGLEEMVAKRTAEFVAAKEEAERRKDRAVIDLIEIKNLKEQLEAEKAYLQEEIKLEHNYTKIIGQSDALKKVLHKVKQIANSDTTVLILGETGTGKELIARAIHDNSPRKNRTLVKVNCAALPANLIESELFGHEKGAFTGSISKHLGRFEVANGGTFFLDEMGELPLELQGKLLRVLQEGEFERVGGSRTIKVDTRIIAATNRNLEEEVRKSRFREDLWYRLNIFPITIPPLRDRPEDIPLLVDFFVKKIAKRMGKPIEIIPVSVMNTLKEYPWPGNIRELENVLERAVINSSGPKLHLADELRKLTKNVCTSPKTMEAVEQNHILEVLEMTNWKVSGKGGASEILGLDRSTLRARMVKLNIEKL